jgi:putative N6-adenine-specific DNA methylase
MAAAEIQNLGASKVHQRFRGLQFTADIEAVYRINYGSRLLTRILAPLISFDCHSTKYLYKTAMEIPCVATETVTTAWWLVKPMRHQLYILDTSGIGGTHET